MKLVLHSVSYAGGWEGQSSLSLRDFIGKAADLGFDGVELMAKRPHLSPLDTGEKETGVLKDQLADHGLECSCLAGYTDFTMGMESPMIPLDEMQLLYVKTLVRIAAELGCPLIRIFTGYERGQVPFWQQWDHCVALVKECARLAQERNLSIGVQNHHDLAVDGGALGRFLDEVDEPNCLPMFDAWTGAVQGLDMLEELRAISKNHQVSYTTVADYIRVPRFKYDPDKINYRPQEDLLLAVPMGEGFIDYAGYFEALKGMGFNGPVAYEMCSRLRDGGSETTLDAYARKFVEYLGSFL